MPSSLETAPNLFTVDRYKRLLLASDGEPFTTDCPLCFLPGFYLKATRRQGFWMARCDPCDARIFLPRVVLAWPLVGLGEHLRAGGVERVQRRLTATLEDAQCALDEIRWVDAQQDDGVIRPTLSVKLACLSCGEPSSVRISEDKKGRPYAICGVCGTRSFLRHDRSVRMLVGLSEWLRRTYRTDAPEESPWWRLQALGKTQWSTWSRDLTDNTEMVERPSLGTVKEAR